MAATTLETIAAQINAAHAEGKTVTVDRHEVRSHGSAHKPAHVWGTGSLSVLVRGRAPGKTNTIWFKPGQPLPTITVA